MDGWDGNDFFRCRTRLCLKIERTYTIGESFARKFTCLFRESSVRRYEFSDEQWDRIAPLFPQKPHPGKAGRPPCDNRPIVNGILWVLHTGAPWRDLPEYYGPWQTVFCRFNAWRRDGT